MAKNTKDSYHHGDLRQTLIDAAIVLISEKGPNSFSLREVAKRAGVSHTAPYRHFSDKHALLAAIAEIGFAELASRLIDVQKNYEDDPKEQFMVAEQTYVELAVASPEITLLMFGGFLQPEKCHKELLTVSENAFQQLFNIISNGQKANLLVQQDTMQLALAAWSMVHGLSMLITGGQMAGHINTHDDVVNKTNILSRLLLEGIKQR